jgi:signal recognition particle subunit SEC65
MKVFISHSQEDETLARRIADVLKKAGLDVWDDREIFPGDNWAEKIARALNESNAMVVLLTADALKSRWVQHDISFALGENRYKKRLIPVIVGSPEKSTGDYYPWILNRLKTIKLDAHENNEEDLQQIARALLDVSADTTA